MKIHVAHNGKTLGSYSIEDMKMLAEKNEINRSSHVFLPTKQEWCEISKIPDLDSRIFGQEMPPPPPPQPQPNPYQAPQNLDISERIGTASADDMDLFHGYPKCYWRAMFGEKTHWFLEKFKGLATTAEEKAFKSNLDEQTKEMGKLEAALAKSDANKEFGNDQARFSWAGFIFSWPWLAYRKSGIAFGLYAGLSFIVSIIDKLTSSADLSSYSSGKVWALNFFCFSIAPGIWGIPILHKRALKIFEQADASACSFSDRIGRIRDAGNPSWWWAIGFLCFAFTFEMVSSAIFE